MQRRPPIWDGVPVPYEASLEELARLLRRPAPERWVAFVALAHRPGEAALALLREEATSEDPHVRRIALEAIGVHPQGRRLREMVCAGLEDEAPFVIRTACRAAARLELCEAQDALIRLVQIADDATRVAALQALRHLRAESAFGPALGLFDSAASDTVRKEAAWTLRALASPHTWRGLFEMWRSDPLPRHRVWACELAEEHRAADKLPELRGLRDDPDGHVRKRATCAIRTIEEAL